MKYTGDMFYKDGIERNCGVTDAIVTRNHIQIDWEEDGDQGHLDATSEDGEHFRGQYGYSTWDANCQFDLTLYRAKNEVLLFGTWREGKYEGVWVFRLSSDGQSQHRDGK